MKAAVYYDRRDVRVEDVDEPSGPADGEVLVAPLWCGICGTDVHEYTDGPIVTPVDPHPLTGAANPQVLGHEFSAEVLEVGGGVTNVRSGDRVSVMPLIYCGHCYYCRLGQHHLCVTMACTGLSHRWGGLAKAAIVSAGQLTRIPDELDDQQGALVEPIAVCAHGVDRAGVSPGSSVLVTGAGPIGMLSAEYAIARGATTVIVSEPNPGRRSIVEALGVQATLDPTAVDVVEAVRELTDGLGVDAAIECSGSAAALDACIRSDPVARHGQPDRAARPPGADRRLPARVARDHPRRHVVLPGHRLAAHHRPARLRADGRPGRGDQFARPRRHRRRLRATDRPPGQRREDPHQPKIVKESQP